MTFTKIRISLSIMILLVFVILLVSCSDNSQILSPEQNTVIKGKVYLFNGLGDVGTLSIIDSVVTNDTISLGRWPNDIKYYDSQLFVVNSGNNNIMVIDEPSLIKTNSIQLEETSNPMFMTVANGKIYVTSLFGTGIEVRNFEDGSYIKTIQIEGGESGTDAIISKDGFVYVNRNNYGPDEFYNYVFNDETILKINVETDSIVDSVSVGVNVHQLLFDKEGELHVLCKGSYDVFEGEIDIIDINSFTVKDTILLGSQPGNFAMNSEGMVYVAISGMNPDYTGFGGIMKYNSTANEIINGVNDLIYDSPDCGILGLCIDGEDKVYAPLFDENQMLIFENDSLVKMLITGNGPQGMVFVPNNEE